jgi:hypothetical protein
MHESEWHVIAAKEGGKHTNSTPQHNRSSSSSSMALLLLLRRRLVMTKAVSGVGLAGWC